MATKNSTLTQEYLHYLFDYKDGNLYWKTSRGTAKIGALAGCKGKLGYWQISFNGKIYKAHRIIFLMLNGYLPKYIDHIDGNRSNNKIENLREASHIQNCFNRKIMTNTTPAKGVVWKPHLKKWEVSCWKEAKKYYGGYFENKEDAIKASIILRKKYHGEFARHF
jgi:hypothetical protein